MNAISVTRREQRGGCHGCMRRASRGESKEKGAMGERGIQKRCGGSQVKMQMSERPNRDMKNVPCKVSMAKKMEKGCELREVGNAKGCEDGYRWDKGHVNPANG